MAKCVGSVSYCERMSTNQALELRDLKLPLQVLKCCHTVGRLQCRVYSAGDNNAAASKVTKASLKIKGVP